jgi:secondary thiamine-phosphate synthase enzyme
MESGLVKFYADTIEVRAKKRKRTVSLNSHLNDALKKSGVRNGLIIVQSLHTTAGIIGQEDEEGILNYDLPRLLEKLIPVAGYYRHDDFRKRNPPVGSDERLNARAHLEYLLAAHPSVTLIVQDYRIQFGSWQSALLIDFDPVGRKSRRVVVAVFGE